MHYFFQRTLVLAVLLIFVSTAFAQSRGGRPAKVFVAPVKYEYEQAIVEVVGTAEAVRSVVLFPAVSDRVVAINFQPGQAVKKGFVLVELDNRRQQVALNRAQITLEDAERNLTRLLESQRRGAVTQAQIDEATTTKALAEVEVRAARTELEDRLIRAPFDGIVGLTDIEVGDRITQQTSVTTIDDRNELFVNFNAPEASLNALYADTPVSLQPWSERNVDLSASIAQIDSRIAATDRTVRARALLSNENDIFRPGMSFRVKLTTQGERFIAIPEASLSWGVGGAFVWKAQDGTAVKTSVQVKQRLRGRILISGDISDTDTLIVEGVQRLRDGQAIISEPFNANAFAGGAR